MGSLYFLGIVSFQIFQIKALWKAASGSGGFFYPKVMLASVLFSSPTLCPTSPLDSQQQMPQGCTKDPVTCACVLQLLLYCLPPAYPRGCGFLLVQTGITAPLWHPAGQGKEHCQFGGAGMQPVSVLTKKEVLTISPLTK